MKKEWFFDRLCGEHIAICTEDGKIVDVRVENEQSGDVVGNIYKGRVANVVQGMQAAFVSCGMEKNCYLPLNEGSARFAKYDGSVVESVLALKEGDEILVQVIKPPCGTKGAKVSFELSFVGKTVIYLPKTEFRGISRKITDEEKRAELLKAGEKLCKKGEGFILRTAALTATKKHLKAEYEYLRRVYLSVVKNAETAAVGSAVYCEYDLPVKLMRDHLDESVYKVYVGSDLLYEKLVKLGQLHPEFSHKQFVPFEHLQSKTYAAYKISEQIFELTKREVGLSNGAYLVIDHTEAMTVIDVNTGRFVGNSDLESTVFETNLLAAKEIARQVRLRNIAGIITVDFIDMEEEAHRNAVNEALEKALLSDREKCRVLPMSDLCVTMFTRKRTGRALSEFLLKPCDECEGSGLVYSDIYMAMRIRNAVSDCFEDGYRAAVIDLNHKLMDSILTEQYFKSELSERWKGKRVYLIPLDIPSNDFRVHGDNASVLSLPDNAQILY